MTKPKASKALVVRTKTGGRTARVDITPAGLRAVEKMTANGNALVTVARTLGVHPKTLRDMRDRDTAFAAALETGHATLADEITNILLTHAREGHVVAAIFLAKARLGWLEGRTPEGPRQAVTVNIQIPPPMSDQEFRNIIDGQATVVPDDQPRPKPGVTR